MYGDCHLFAGKNRISACLWSLWICIPLWGQTPCQESKPDTLITLPGPQEKPSRSSLPLPFSYNNVRDYIFSHLSYPPQAVAEEIEGTVSVGFILTQNGDIDSVRIVQSVHPLLDEEALRLIRNMPRWKPVYFRGEPVSLAYEVPVIFELLPAEPDKDSISLPPEEH